MILVVEDEVAVQRLVSKLLTREGYSVALAKDGVEALEVAATEGDAIELVLTDAVMPNLSGIELAERLRADRPGLKLILMSGYAQDGSMEGVEKGDDLAILEKPFSPDRLVEVVRGALGQD